MLLLNLIYKRWGLRRSEQLLRPRVANLAEFEWSKNSIWHWVDYSGLSLGPDVSDPLLSKVDKKIFIYSETELGSEKRGNPRRLGMSLAPLIRTWLSKYKRFRRWLDLSKPIADPNTLSIVNYAPILKAYRYPRSIYSTYYRWLNSTKTIMDGIANLAQEETKTQWLFVDLPSILPSFQKLNLHTKHFSQKTLFEMNSPELLFLLEFWKWLSLEHRSESIIPEMTEAQMSRIIIAFRFKTVFSLVNLQTLNSFRYVEGVTDPHQKVKIDPLQLQKRFLRGLMHIVACGTGEETIEEEAEDGTIITKATITKDDDTSEARDSSHDEYLEQLASLDSDLEALEDVEIVTRSRDRAVKDDVNILNKKAYTDPHETDSSHGTDQDDLDTDLTYSDTDDSDPDTDSEADQSQGVIHSRGFIQKRRDDSSPDIEADSSSFDTNSSIDDIINGELDSLADSGLIEASEYKRKLKLLEKSRELKIDGQLISDIAKVDESLLSVDDESMPESITVLDKSMLKSKTSSITAKYTREVLPKDIVSMSEAIQKAGLIITDYEIEKVDDYLDSYQVHTLRVQPVVGAASTLRFRVPNVDKNGYWRVGGKRYLTRTQRSDLPIRKISPTRVALSTYYGKTFVIRSEKKANNYAEWLQTQISYLSITEIATVKNLHPANVYHPQVKTPRDYSCIAQGCRSFEYAGYECIFDTDLKQKYFTDEQIAKYETKGSILFGIDKKGSVLFMDRNSSIYSVYNDDITPLGTIKDWLNIDTSKEPIEYAECRIFSKNIPAALVLGYRFGLSELIRKLGCEVRSVLIGSKMNLASHEYPVHFSDETLIFSKDDPLSTMILAGFRAFEKTTRNYSVYTFDKPQVYLKLLEQHNLSVRYLREMDLLFDMFVDPISEQVLKQMNEPTSYTGLVVRSCELLLTDWHHDPLDITQMRLKGYERFAGSVYSEMISAIREHKAKTNRKQAAIDLNPYAVWRSISEDSSKLPADELNPIQQIKETESVTFGGTGGRNSRSMVKSSRVFHPNDAGVISEATKDSSDVAINTYLTADPQITSLRGITKATPIRDLSPTQLVSTSALVSVSGDQDSAQRLNMVSIQQDHAIATKGYKAPYVRTGYEEIIALRASETFAAKAKSEGTITRVTNDFIEVTYSDDTKDSFALGKTYGKSSGMGTSAMIPRTITTHLKVGDKVTPNQVVTYDSAFFAIDKLNPNAVIWKNQITARVALLESRQTHEDACSISQELADLLQTQITKVKTVTLNFNEEVRNVLPVGSIVDYDTILLYIEDASIASSSLFDEETLSTLKSLSKQTPRAKAKGIIERIEVLYHGDIQDMSKTLADMAITSDKQLRQEAKAKGLKPYTGQVNEGFRIDGEPMQLDTLVIRFYITGDVVASLGDKVVFGNQLKSVISEVMDSPITTESGAKIDAVFGAQSIFNRIVNSAFTIGTTNRLLELISEQTAKIYFNEE